MFILPYESSSHTSETELLTNIRGKGNFANSMLSRRTKFSDIGDFFKSFGKNESTMLTYKVIFYFYKNLMYQTQIDNSKSQIDKNKSFMTF